MVIKLMWLVLKCEIVPWHSGLVMWGVGLVPWHSGLVPRACGGGGPAWLRTRPDPSEAWDCVI